MLFVCAEERGLRVEILIQKQQAKRVKIVAWRDNEVESVEGHTWGKKHKRRGFEVRW